MQILFFVLSDFSKCGKGFFVRFLRSTGNRSLYKLAEDIGSGSVRIHNVQSESSRYEGEDRVDQVHERVWDIR